MDKASRMETCMGPAYTKQVDECSAEAKTMMPSEAEVQEALTHVEEGFNMWEYVKGYVNEQVLVFECLGWLTDDGHPNVDNIQDFMSDTAVHAFFSGEMGNNPVMECTIESETCTINDFFRNVEPNNQVPCDCEGEKCKDDPNPDGDGGDDEAEDRFSLKALIAGEEEIEDQELIKKIHDGECHHINKNVDIENSQIKQKIYSSFSRGCSAQPGD
jgi:hypothetical protein